MKRDIEADMHICGRGDPKVIYKRDYESQCSFVRSCSSRLGNKRRTGIKEMPRENGRHLIS